MALVENTLLGKVNKVEIAIERFKIMEPEEGYWLATSCGKDSGAIERLAQMAGVKYEAHYSLTSVDPPELVRFAQSKEKKKEIIIDQPRYEDGSPMTMWNLIPKKKLPPMRNARYCCEKLKESSGKGRITATGVRWAESNNRARNQGEITITDKKAIKMFQGTDSNFRLNKQGGVVLNLDNAENRRMVELCYRTRKTLINPIIDWTDSDVWEFHKTENISYCEKYGEITKDFTCTGWKRIGCLGCPMAQVKQREIQFHDYPKYKEAYIRAFDKMLKERKETIGWQSGEEVFDWWLYGNGNIKIDPNQLELDLEI